MRWRPRDHLSVTATAYHCHMFAAEYIPSRQEIPLYDNALCTLWDVTMCQGGVMTCGAPS